MVGVPPPESGLLATVTQSMTALLRSMVVGVEGLLGFRPWLAFGRFGVDFRGDIRGKRYYTVRSVRRDGLWTHSWVGLGCTRSSPLQMG